MIVSKEKCESGAVCIECGAKGPEENLHHVVIGDDKCTSVYFYLCYSCLSTMRSKMKKVLPEGKPAFEICRSEFSEPENAKNCLYCRDCAAFTEIGRDWFECVLENFSFEEGETPKEKRCSWRFNEEKRSGFIQKNVKKVKTEVDAAMRIANKKEYYSGAEKLRDVMKVLANAESEGRLSEEERVDVCKYIRNRHGFTLDENSK